MLIEINGKTPKIDPSVFIAPNAMIIGDVEILAGTSIWYGAVIRGDMAFIRVGRHTNIQDNCTVHTEVDKPTLIGDHVTVGHNAVLHSCTVENNCLIGISAVVLDDAVIKTGSIVAAASLVKYGQTVGPCELVAGVPAVLKKSFETDIIKELAKPSDLYCKMAEVYRKQP
jgi:carbonic anhydrase/acetyltransferase-like protein (isoleucine patch superfamily)